MLRSPRTERGDGTVGYVLVIALIVIGLIAAALLLRKRVTAIGRGTTGKIGKMAADKNQPGQAHTTAKTPQETGGAAATEGTPAGPSATAPPPGAASGDDEKDKRNRIATSFHETEPPPPAREERFSFGGISWLRWLLLFASVIGTAIALWFMFAGKMKHE